MVALRKARIYDPKNNIPEFYVQFNPNSLEYSIGNDIYSTKKTKDEHTQTDLSQSDVTKVSNSGRLSVKLFFYTYTNETTYDDVNVDIAHLRRFFRYTASSTNGNQPVIIFAWGTLALRGIMTSLSVSYQMFAPDGTPVQAEASITIEGSDPQMDYEASSHASGKQFKSARELAGGQNGQLPDDLSWLFL